MTEKHDNPSLPPSPPPSLLSISFFDTRIFVDHRRPPLRNFRYCEPTKVWQRNVIIAPSLPPSLLSIIFFDTRIFVDHRRVPLRNLSVLWDSQLSMENCDITFSSKNFSIPELNYILMGSPTKFFATVRQQIFWRKSWYSPHRHIFYRYPKLSETQMDSSLKWFCTVRQNNLRENRDTRAPQPLILKFFYTRIFLKHRSFPLRSFSVLWDDKLPLENRDITFSSTKFLIPEFSDTPMGSPTKFFGAVSQQVFYRKSWYSPLRHSFLRYPKLSET